MTGTTRGGRRSNAATAAIPTTDVMSTTKASAITPFNVARVTLVPRRGAGPR